MASRIHMRNSSGKLNRYLYRSPFARFDTGEGDLTLPGDDSFNPDLSLVIEDAFHYRSIRKTDPIRFSTYRAVEWIQQVHFDPCRLAGRDGGPPWLGITHGRHLF